MKRTNTLRFIYVIVVLLIGTLPLYAQQPNARALKTLLAQQGFSGELHGKVHFTALGTLACHGKKLQAFFYEWEQSNAPGQAIHASHRIVFIAPGDRYVGSYTVEDRPLKTGPETIVFGYPQKAGNAIHCGAAGLPKTVLLNGENQVLAK